MKSEISQAWKVFHAEFWFPLPQLEAELTARAPGGGSRDAAAQKIMKNSQWGLEPFFTRREKT